MSEMDMFFNSLGKLYDIAPWPWNLIIVIVLVLLGIFFGFMVKMVPSGADTVRTRFKQVLFDKDGNPRSGRPGFNVVMPWAFSLEIVSTLDQIFELRTVTVRYAMYDLVDFTATVTFAVRSVYRTKYIVQDLKERLTSVCEESVRSTLELFPQSEIKFRRDEINAMFAELVAPVATELGTSFKALTIANIKVDTQALQAGATAYAGAEIGKGLGSIGASLSQN